MEKEFNLSERIWTIQNLEQAKVFPLHCVSTTNIKEFISFEHDLIVRLFKKIKMVGDGEGIIKKRDWDEFIIKRNELAGEKFA